MIDCIEFDPIGKLVFNLTEKINILTRCPLYTRNNTNYSHSYNNPGTPSHYLLSVTRYCTKISLKTDIPMSSFHSITVNVCTKIRIYNGNTIWLKSWIKLDFFQLKISQAKFFPFSNDFLNFFKSKTWTSWLQVFTKYALFLTISILLFSLLFLLFLIFLFFCNKNNIDNISYDRLSLMYFIWTRFFDVYKKSR